MRTISIGRVMLGEGRPKICVPITPRTWEELIEEAGRAAAEPAAQIVEWRADWYHDLCREGSIVQALAQLKRILGEIPVLFTIRSREEGGEISLSDSQYKSLICQAIQGEANAVDAELSRGEDIVEELIRYAHEHHVPVIVSSHDFMQTPSKKEMISRLYAMHRMGADICKLAVMPRTPADVLLLLEATCTLRQIEPDILLITMSMGQTGVVSRISGETFGSVLTFGTVGKASAPGQIAADCLSRILDAVHQ